MRSARDDGQKVGTDPMKTLLYINPGPTFNPRSPDYQLAWDGTVTAISRPSLHHRAARREIDRHRPIRVQVHEGRAVELLDLPALPALLCLAQHRAEDEGREDRPGRRRMTRLGTGLIGAVRGSAFLAPGSRRR